MKKSLIIVFTILIVYLLTMLLLFADFSGNKAKEKKELQTIEKYFVKDEIKSVEKIITSNEGMDTILNSLDVLNIDGYDSFKPANYNLTNLSILNKNYFEKYVNSIDDLNNLSVDQKIIFDFDNDKQEEQLLLISNSNNNKAKKWFSAIYYIDEKVNKIVSSSAYQQHDPDFLKYELLNIADLNNDNIYEIIIKKSNNESTCNDLYELNDGSFKEVFICGLPTI